MGTHKDRVRFLALAMFLASAGPSAAPPQVLDVYRWSDEAGNVHYGDQPVPGAERLSLTITGRSLHRVKRVLDGDTIELADGTRVRLIAVNAPEIARRARPGEPGSRAAHQHLKQLLGDGRVRLVPGREKTDRYGRLLAHVFTPSGEDVAVGLLRAGHAHVVIHPPNLSHIASYIRAERSARQARRGLWQLERYAIQPATRAPALRNRYARLRGRITAVQKKRKYTYLSIGTGLTAAIANDRVAQFEAAADKPLPELTGDSVIVRGWIRQRDGRPFLRLRHPLQLTP